MQKLIVVFLILLSVSFSFSDETGGKVGFSVKAGAGYYSGDLDNSKFGFYYEGGIHWWITDYIGLAVNYNMPYLHVNRNNDNTEYFKSQLKAYGLSFRLKLLPSSSINPYLSAGYEMYSSDPKNKKDKSIVIAETDGNAIPVGLGFEFYMNDTWAINLEAVNHFALDDHVDTKVRGSRNDSWLTLAAGISINFGKPKDTDGDGIIDKEDKDPLHAEDFDGFEDEDGKPDLDNDNDGILDKDDKAPMEPEDKDGFKDDDGVPDPDNDNDGILDVNDKAPNSPEDIDGFEDEDGKPDPDNDNDGILDIDDKCPNEPETINGYEDEDGCPDKKPEIAVEKGKAIVLEGVTFASGSANLTENSKIILNKVVNTMKENPEIEVEIRGYTDNTGNKNFNYKISQRRADSVKEYLVRNGIDSSRIQTKGFGPEEPIAPNNTKEGRAKNRRIEFYRIK